MEKHRTYFNLLDAFKKGCPICFPVKENIPKSMDDFLCERVNGPGTRNEIGKSSGYCNRHARQLQSFGDGFGQSIIDEDLLGILKEKTEKSTKRVRKK